MKQLGFGTMRLPVAHGQVDLKETEKLFDRFLAAGFTYFDTAYGYHDYKSGCPWFEPLRVYQQKS